MQAAETQKALIGNLAALPTRPAPPSAGTLSPGEDWPKVLALIAQATGDANKLELDAQQKIRDIDRKIADLDRELRSLAPARTEQTEVSVHVVAQSPLDADFTIHDREDSADLMNLIRHDLGFSKTESRFPAKGTCLAIYSRAVNSETALDLVLRDAFPWCAAWG